MKLLTIIILLLNSVQMYPIQATPQTEPKATTKRGQLVLNCGKKQSLFFNAHWEGAKMLQDKYNIPMALSLIQWALESEWGKSDLAKENNFGGIKYNGKYHHFESKKAFYFAYSRTMNQECYQKIDRTNLEAWLNAVQWSECRYAKSPKYKAKLKRLIKQYKLDNL